MTFSRPILAKSPVDLMTSAVPSQLLPTNITSRSGAAEAAGAVTQAASTAAEATAWVMRRRVRAFPLAFRAGSDMASPSEVGAGGEGACRRGNLNLVKFRSWLLDSRLV